MIDDFGESEDAKAKVLSDGRLDRERLTITLLKPYSREELSATLRRVPSLPAVNTLNCDYKLFLHEISLRIGNFDW